MQKYAMAYFSKYSWSAPGQSYELQMIGPYGDLIELLKSVFKIVFLGDKLWFLANVKDAFQEIWRKITISEANVLSSYE